MLDCSGQGLKEIPFAPVAAHQRGAILVLNLRRNDIKSFSEQKLLKWYPGLKRVDLRQNRNLDCAKVRLSTKIIFKVDCVRTTDLNISTSSTMNKCSVQSSSLRRYISKTLLSSPGQTCYLISTVSSVANFNIKKSHQSGRAPHVLLLIFIPMTLGISLVIIAFALCRLIRHRLILRRNEQSDRNIEMTIVSSQQTATAHEGSDSSIELYSTQV